MVGVFFLFGLIIGSFLNVLVCRIHTGETILGRSHCPKCQKQIRWFDNVPVLSFFLLRGRCRDCKKQISWQYPLVELLTGVVFALIGWVFFDLENLTTWLFSFGWLFLSGVLLLVLVYDILHMEIPDVALWPGVGLAFLLNLALDFQAGEWIVWETHTVSGLMAALVAFLFFFSLAHFSREKWMGMGDAYLVILLGLALGWPLILLGLFLSFALGAVYGIISIVAKQKKFSSQVPFAPFLVLGTFITLFFHRQIVEWYLGLFRIF